MRAAAEVLCQTHLALKEVIRPGFTTKDLDTLLKEMPAEKEKVKMSELGN